MDEYESVVPAKAGTQSFLDSDLRRNDGNKQLVKGSKLVNYKIDFGSILWETPMQGVRHKVMTQGDKQLRLVEYTKDLEPHWCEKGHIGYVLEGRLEIAFDNETLTYNPGDGVFIPSGSEHKHSGKVLSEFVRVVFVEEP